MGRLPFLRLHDQVRIVFTFFPYSTWHKALPKVLRCFLRMIKVKLAFIPIPSINVIAFLKMKKNAYLLCFVTCTIDESIKGAASLSRYGITFHGNIDV